MTKKAVTMDDVARLARVSKPTVSRALGGHPNVNAETRAKVLAVARKHGYAVNSNAKKLRQKHTNTVAVVLDFSSHRRHRINDPFIFELLAGVSEALSMRNQDLLLSPPRLTDARSYQDFVNSRVVDGFIMLGQGSNEELFNDMTKMKLPFVVWGGITPSTNYCTVGSDNFCGGRLAGERFLQQQRKQVLFVGDTEHIELKLRRDGLREALESGTDTVQYDELLTGDFSFNAHYEAMANHLQKSTPPDAIFACSDTAAMAIINALNEKQLKPNRDYSLVGYNDIDHAAHFSPRITTIRQDTFLAGSLLVEKYMAILAGDSPAPSMMPTDLIVRDT